MFWVINLQCNLCPRNCNIDRNENTGFCKSHTKAKIARIAPHHWEEPCISGTKGSGTVFFSGCTLKCVFCQNYEISWSKEAMQFADRAELVTPEQIAETAQYYRRKGNVGVAFTYNEPLVGYEFVRDTAKIVHERGMVNVLVTNGTADLQVLGELAPYIDAMNIDLKGFTDHYYNEVLGGDRAMTMSFIEEAVKHCHVELTTLIVPGENDSEDEMREMTE